MKSCYNILPLLILLAFPTRYGVDAALSSEKKSISSTQLTRSVTIKYKTPGGSVPIGLKATVKNGVIISASSTTKAGGTSGYYQKAFAMGLSKAVVGKKIKGLKLTTIGGASLTTKVFETFITKSF